MLLGGTISAQYMAPHDGMRPTHTVLSTDAPLLDAGAPDSRRHHFSQRPPSIREPPPTTF
jgi:hypothetical protein